MKTKFLLFLATLTATIALSPLLFADGHPAASVGADAALAKLKEGNQRFSTSKITTGKAVAERRAETAQAQHPFAIVLTCSDSRTSPELVFDQNIGDLFVIRDAGNIVDEHVLGSMEYAVEHLGTRLIVVLGHERCGAVQAALASETAHGHVNSVVHDIQPAVKASKNKPGDKVANCVCENAKQVAARIRAEADLGAAASEVRVVTGIYDLDTGVVEWLKD